MEACVSLGLLFGGELPVLGRAELPTLELDLVGHENTVLWPSFFAS